MSSVYKSGFFRFPFSTNLLISVESIVVGIHESEIADGEAEVAA